NDNKANLPLPTASLTKRSWSLGSIGWIAITIIVIGFLGAPVIKNISSSSHDNSYRFSAEPLTRDIPNSVIFTYDASSSPTDSVFIQQSWDMRTKTWVQKDLHKHTSIYYEPGHYQAKLFVGKEVVKEHSLLIPSNGWLAIIDHSPVPIYLKPDEFLHK